mgnify:CR=1 FL=1
MVKRHRIAVILNQPTPPPSEERLVRVRIEQSGRAVYVDNRDPRRVEFYIDDLSIPVTQVRLTEKVHPLVKEVHPKYPHFGPYFFDKRDEREVFLNNGKPFYLGKHNNKEHKIFIGPRFDDQNYRSRASGPHSVVDSASGTGRIGGVGSQ